MKISLSKFYREVTGATTVNRKTTAAALKRWGVPFDETPGKTDVVDVSYLDSAKATHAAEVAAREAATKAATTARAVLTRDARDADGVSARLARIEAKLDAVLCAFDVKVAA